MLVAATAAFAAGETAEKEYTATAWVIYYPIEIPEAPAPTDHSIPLDDRYQGRSLELIAERTARALPGAGDVLDKIETDYDGEAALLAVAATELGASDAARLANEFARQYVRFWDASDRRRLRTALARVEGRLEAMTPAERSGRPGRRARRRIGEIDRLFTKAPTGAIVAKRARVPDASTGPSSADRAAAGGALGLLLGLGVTVLLERRRPRP